MLLADYLARAHAYRPRRRDEMRAAVVELAARGLRYRDIAQAIGIAEAEVCRLLGELPAEPVRASGAVCRLASSPIQPGCEVCE